MRLGSGDGRRRNGRGRIGNCLDGGDLDGLVVDVVIFSRTEVNPDAPIDESMMVAPLDVSVAEVHELAARD